MTKVLVVDDDVQLRRALVRSLRAHGYDTRYAGGYDEALQAVRYQFFDVVLTDLRMAGKDGIDLILSLGDAAPTTRAILMSAYASARDAQRALETGAFRVLSKPFQTEELLRAVDSAIETRRGVVRSPHGLSLLDMLQMFHCARRSLTLKVEGQPLGFVHLSEGQVVHATRGHLSGIEALEDILQMPAGALETMNPQPVEPTIRQTFPVLLSELMEHVHLERHPAKSESGFMNWGKPLSEGEFSEKVERPEPRLKPLEDDPPFADVFAELEQPSGHSAGYARRLRRAEKTAEALLSCFGEVDACCVASMGRDDLCAWAARGAVPSDGAAWLQLVLPLLQMVVSQGVELDLPEGAPAPLSQLHLTTARGQLLATVTESRSSAVLLFATRCVGSEYDWQRLREVLRELGG